MARPFVLAAILAGLWPTLDPALVEPPAFLSAAPERVAQRFTRCGPGRGQACVIDGDTFKLGQRKIRIVGIDAPETHPANCPEEARLGEAATAELMRLLNQGPFVMTGRIDDMTRPLWPRTAGRQPRARPTDRPSRSPRTCAPAGWRTAISGASPAGAASR